MSQRRVTRVFGHPLHATLTDFPIALLAVTPLFDAGSLWLVDPTLALVAYWCELAGLVATAAAAVVGLTDLLRLESPSPTMTTALRHALFAVLTLTFYVVAFVLRTRGAPPSIAVVALEFLGLVGVGITGWFGGHLVFHHRVGVE
jgi:uncharacterized membrane protein